MANTASAAVIRRKVSGVRDGSSDPLAPMKSRAPRRFAGPRYQRKR
jgi:hypothetical protein